MKISKIEIENFRGIENTQLKLEQKSTVFYGVNGVGKTTILNAIELLYSSIINKIVQNRFKQRLSLEITDIKFGKPFSKISCDITFIDKNKSLSYFRAIQRKDKKKTHDATALKEFADFFRDEFINKEEGMPIFVNYGVNRTVVDIPLRIRNTHTFDKESAFEKSIESKIDFRTFFEWFRYQEDFENEIRVRKDSNYTDASLRSVKTAVYAMMDKVSNLRIERNPLAMKVDKYGISLRVDQLSDGEKCTLALFGDLARRLALANPESQNPLLGMGVVLIDEIELHMHPSWQRKILPILNETFPNIQFIVTTHSPQVLGELNDDYNIFGIEKTDNTIEYNGIHSLVGWDSNYILKCFMDTDSLNSNTQKLIDTIYDLIMDGNFEESEKHIKQLEKLTDSAHEDVVKARMLIKRGRR